MGWERVDVTPKLARPKKLPIFKLLIVLDNFLKKKFFMQNFFLKVFVSFRFVYYSYPPPVTVNSETKRNKKKKQKT